MITIVIYFYIDLVDDYYIYSYYIYLTRLL